MLCWPSFPFCCAGRTEVALRQLRAVVLFCLARSAKKKKERNASFVHAPLTRATHPRTVLIVRPFWVIACFCYASDRVMVWLSVRVCVIEGKLTRLHTIHYTAQRPEANGSATIDLGWEASDTKEHKTGVFPWGPLAHRSFPFFASGFMCCATDPRCCDVWIPALCNTNPRTTQQHDGAKAYLITERTNHLSWTNQRNRATGPEHR